MEKKTMMYSQQRIDFDRPANAEHQHVAEATSTPPPADQGTQAPPLVRPDRQLTYDGLDSWSWPDPTPLHDHDTITVDRIRDDIDGPSHRFLIQRGDMVEAFFSKDRLETGEVVGISHANQEVRVRFDEGTDGIWFPKGCIYPIAHQETRPTVRGRRFSEVIAEVNSRNGDGLTEADRILPATVEQRPFTFDEFKNVYARLSDGSLAFVEYRSEFARLRASQDSLKGELLSRFNAKQLVVLATRFGSWQARRSTKDANACHVVSKMLSAFVLDGCVSYSSLSGETYESAVKKKVLALSEGEYHRVFEKRQAASFEKQKALENPETFGEFRTFIHENGEQAMSDEQLGRYDSLHADMTREKRAAEAPSTVQKFQDDALHGLNFERKTGFHEKRQCPLHIVRLTNRVERDAFDELNRKAKMLGGWWSSFKKSDAGFQFLAEDQADRFCSLLTGDADRSDVLEFRKERKEASAAERLHELADEVAARADERIERSNNSLQNTIRRADIQAGIRGQAFADLAMSRTLHSIAEALSTGKARYLDGIRHKTQVATLNTILSLAKWARIRTSRRADDETQFSHGRRLDRTSDEPIGPATVRFAEYPYPCIYKRHLEDLVSQARTRSGVKLSADKLRKRLAREQEDCVTFSAEHDIESLADFLERAKAANLETERVEASLESYKRLRRANVHDIYELRAALREYLSHRAEARGDDPVSVAERELLGKDLPGFFPTPWPVIERMMELASIERGHRVLEPSCGKGDILDALKEQFPDIELIAIERNYTLSDVLSAKGHDVMFEDFCVHHGSYDRVVMNPPFENGQDITHVEHAYSLLRPGGRLVSVVSEGPFFRSDRKSIAFREWLQEVNADIERLPDDAFKGREAFRQTAVRTRLISLAK